MDNRERLLTALDRGQPDTVPVWELAFNEPSIIGIARHFMDKDQLPEPRLAMFMTDKEKIQTLAALATLVRELDVDGITAISLPPRVPIDDDHIRDAFGVINHLSDAGEPVPVEGPIKDPTDLKNYRMRKPHELDFLMLDFLRKALPERIIAFDVQATFKISWSLRGPMVNLLMDYILNPGLARDLARMVTDYCLECVDMAIAKGADFIVMDGDLAFNQGPIMSPAHYDEFIGPYHREICEMVHKRGKKIIKHSDGLLTPIIPNLIGAGFDGIHPIQPQCMDIGETKREFGDRLCILGNIDCSFLLVFGSEDEVRRNVKDTIEAAAWGGGYIISSSNSIHPGVKPENYIAMVRAAREFGRYE